MQQAPTGAERVHSRFAADPDYSELLEMFVASIPEKVESLRGAFAQGAWRELQTLAHQLKGAGGGYGFDGLTPRAAALEQTCKAGQPEAAAEALAELAAYLGRISA